MNERDFIGQASQDWRLGNGNAVEIHPLLIGLAQGQPRRTFARIDLELGQLADPHVKSKRAPYSDGVPFSYAVPGFCSLGLSRGGPGAEWHWPGRGRMNLSRPSGLPAAALSSCCPLFLPGTYLTGRSG